MDTLNREAKAKALFEARPHNLMVKRPGQDPVRLVPDWNEQPEFIKEVFRKAAAEPPPT